MRKEVLTFTNNALNLHETVFIAIAPIYLLKLENNQLEGATYYTAILNFSLSCCTISSFLFSSSSKSQFEET